MGHCFTYARITSVKQNYDSLSVVFHARKMAIQSTLGFETLDKAAALGLETATPLTDPRQYINSNLGFRNLKI